MSEIIIQTPESIEVVISEDSPNEVTISQAADIEVVIETSGIQGPPGSTGATGPTGPTGPQGIPGVGVPAGGTIGQVLTKIDGTDYNDQWTTPDHGALTGLADDDHTQYHNDTRGDARYYTKTANDTLLADKVTKNSAITGATKTKITYDSKGLVLSGDVLGVADLPAIGSNTQMLFNDSGTPSGDANCTWDKTNKRVTNTANALASTTQTSHLLENSTAATTGSRVQVSPATEWKARGWKTNATAASQPLSFRAYTSPITASVNPIAQWNLQYSINSGAFTDALTYKNSVQDGVSTGLFTVSGFQKISANNSSTVDTLQNFDITNPSGSRTHQVFRFNTTIRSAISAYDDGSLYFQSAGSARSLYFSVGSTIGSTFLIAQIYSEGYYSNYNGFFGGKLTAGSPDLSTTTTFSSYGSTAVKGAVIRASTTLDHAQTAVYVDASNSNICAGTPTACSSYVSQGSCDSHAGVGCSWFAGFSCSGGSGTDSGTCTGQGSGCNWDELSCSGANNTDQTTCETQDDAYGGSCSWDTSTCPGISDESTCNGTTGCSWGTTCLSSPDQGTCESNFCTWNYTNCGDSFFDEESCNAQSPCSWDGSSCTGQYNTSCTGDTCTGSLCNGNYNTGNCSGSYGAGCQGTADCANLTDNGETICEAESGCVWTSGVTLTLPPQSIANRSNTSRIYMIMNIGASGSVTIVPNSSDTSPVSTINSASSLTLSSQYSKAILHHHNVQNFCTTFTSESPCTVNVGCNWSAYICGQFSEGECGSQSGCSWNSMVGSCEGTYSGTGGSCSGTYISARKWFLHNNVT